MPFSNQEKINNADKLALQIAGTANDAPGEQFWDNESFAWTPVIPPARLWADFDNIPGAVTPIDADNAVLANPTFMEKRKVRLTLRIESNDRAYLARSVFNDNTSSLLDNGILPALFQINGGASNGYVARLYNGDPDAGGVEITTTQYGAGKRAWDFNYAIGILKVSTDTSATFRSIYDGNGLWLVWYRYIGDFIGGTGAVADPSRLYLTVTQPTHGYPVGPARIAVTWDDVNDKWVGAIATGDDTLASGLITEVIDVDTFEVTLEGRVYQPGHGLNTDEYYYLSETVAGAIDGIEPSISQPLLYVYNDNNFIVRFERPVGLGGPGDGLIIQEDGATIVSNTGFLNFISDFTVIEDPPNVARITLTVPAEAEGKIEVNLDPVSGTSPPASTVIRNQAEYDALGYNLKYLQDVPRIIPPTLTTRVLANMGPGTYLNTPLNPFYAPEFGSDAQLSVNNLLLNHRGSLFLNSPETYFRRGIAYVGTDVTEVQPEITGNIVTNNTLLRTDAGTWVVDEHLGRSVLVESGSSAGEKRRVESNTTNTLTLVGGGLSTTGACSFKLVEPAAVVLDSTDGVTRNGARINFSLNDPGATALFNNVQFGTPSIPIYGMDSVGQSRFLLINCVVHAASSGFWLVVGYGGGAVSECYINNLNSYPPAIAPSPNGFFIGDTVIDGNPRSGWGHLTLTANNSITIRNSTIIASAPGNNNHLIGLRSNCTVELENRIRLKGNTNFNGIHLSYDAGASTTLITDEPADIQINDCESAILAQAGANIVIEDDIAGTGNAVAWEIEDGASVVVPDPTGLGGVVELRIDGEDFTYAQVVPSSGDLFVGQKGSRFLKP